MSRSQSKSIRNRDKERVYAQRAPSSRTIFRFIDAAKDGKVSVLAHYIGRGVDPNITDIFFKRTALHWAILSGHLEAVQFLSDCCDPEIRDIRGINALIAAARRLTFDKPASPVDTAMLSAVFESSRQRRGLQSARAVASKREKGIVDKNYDSE